MNKLMYRVYYKVKDKKEKWSLLAAFVGKKDSLDYAGNHGVGCIETKVMVGNRKIWKSHTNL